MDPIVFELLGSVLVGGMIWLTLLRRPKNTSLTTMPVLAVRKTRQVSSNRHRQPSSSTKVKNRGASPSSTGNRRRTRTKTGESAGQAIPPPAIGAAGTATLETCPSCGLQAPDKLLAEHFLGSPSHRNGPEKVATVETASIEPDSGLMEDDSKQSVRNLLQILVPPRAFGRRHAHRSMGLTSPVVQDLGPSRRTHR